MWRNFRFLHNRHAWKAEISPHGKLFLHLSDRWQIPLLFWWITDTMFMWTITNYHGIYSHHDCHTKLWQSRTYITILRFRAARKALDWLVLLSPGSILPSHWLHLPPLGPNLLPCGLARPCKAMQGKGFMQNKWQKHSFRVEFISLHFQESFVQCRHLTSDI